VGRFDSRRWWTVLPLIPFTNALNRGESYHKLVRAAAYANGGKLRVRTDQEQQLWSECSRLLANCIIYYNAGILSELLERAERRQDYQRADGGVVTNFLTESGTVNLADESGKQFIYTTLGTATGDLAGALGVYIFSITPGVNGVVAKVHHHWVTDAGDTIYLQDATANAFQVGPYSGIHAVADNSYTVNIIGGTGRFAGATGQLSTIGVLDTKQGKVVLRYQGTICFGRPE
jgi:hypothetical protein